jgi:hypothetical protein
MHVAWRFQSCGGERLADAACYKEAIGDTLHLDGRPILRVQALLSGTFGHFHDQPVLLLVLPIDEDRSALLETYLTDLADTMTIVRIARTVRRLPLSP